MSSKYKINNESLDTLYATADFLPDRETQYGSTSKVTYSTLNEFGFKDTDNSKYITSDGHVAECDGYNYGTWGLADICYKYKHDGKSLPLIDKSTAPSPKKKSDADQIYFPSKADGTIKTMNGCMRQIVYLNDFRKLGEHNWIFELFALGWTIYIQAFPCDRSWEKLKPEDKDYPTDDYQYKTRTKLVDLKSDYILLYLQADGGGNGISKRHYVDSNNYVVSYGGAGGSGGFAALSINSFNYKQTAPLQIRYEAYPTTELDYDFVEYNDDFGCLYIYKDINDYLKIGSGLPGYDASVINLTANKVNFGGIGGTTHLSNITNAFPRYIKETYCIVDMLDGVDGGRGYSEIVKNGNKTVDPGSYPDYEALTGVAMIYHEDCEQPVRVGTSLEFNSGYYSDAVCDLAGQDEARAGYTLTGYNGGGGAGFGYGAVAGYPSNGTGNTGWYESTKSYGKAGAIWLCYVPNE